ncbi:MAG: NAD(P)/FAD-dependent oxidoreductase [Gaiellales bacterium]
MSVPGVTSGPLRSSYEIVIVGAGVQGLALAHELAVRGVRGICVLDAEYPGYGASGRNGELIRSAFSSVEWARFFDISLTKWESLSGELDFNVLFTPAGYLVLGSTPGEMARYRQHQVRHAELGIHPTRVLSRDEALETVPSMNPELVAGGLFQPAGGYAHHDAVVWAYARAAARAGVEIHPHTAVTGLGVRGGAIARVETGRGTIDTSLVVNAAGGHARHVAALAGVVLPTRTARLEAVVTESLRPFLRPAVALPALLGYAHQTTRGEFVGGTEQKVLPDSDSTRCTFRGLRDACQKFVRAFPVLSQVRLVRHWAGIVDVTPDLAPIVGPVPEVEGLWLDCGWVYGFMGAPAAGLLLAEAIETGRMPEPIAPFSLQRLRDGALIVEESLVVAADVHAA